MSNPTTFNPTTCNLVIENEFVYIVDSDGKREWHTEGIGAVNKSDLKYITSISVRLLEYETDDMRKIIQTGELTGLEDVEIINDNDGEDVETEELLEVLAEHCSIKSLAVAFLERHLLHVISKMNLLNFELEYLDTHSVEDDYSIKFILRSLIPKRRGRCNVIALNDLVSRTTIKLRCAGISVELDVFPYLMLHTSLDTLKSITITCSTGTNMTDEMLGYFLETLEVLKDLNVKIELHNSTRNLLEKRGFNNL